MKPNQTSESTEQQLIFNHCNYLLGKYPELELLYHTPNGGKRDKKTAIMLKREGVKAGVPDLHLPVARGMYHSLYIELKAGDNKPTANQKHWLYELTRQNHFAVACKGYEQAIQTIINYLNLKAGQDYFVAYKNSTIKEYMLINIVSIPNYYN